MHQTVARVVVLPLALVVDAWSFVVAIPLTVFARITHRASDVAPSLLGALRGLSVKTPWQLLRGVVQESAEAPGRVAAAVSAWS